MNVMLVSEVEPNTHSKTCKIIQPGHTKEQSGECEDEVFFARKSREVLCGVAFKVACGGVGSTPKKSAATVSLDISLHHERFAFFFVVSISLHFCHFVMRFCCLFQQFGVRTHMHQSQLQLTSCSRWSSKQVIVAIVAPW